MSTGLVDLTTFNKLLAEKQRLSSTLRKLQEASNGALAEFNELKIKFTDLARESNELRDNLRNAEIHKQQLKGRLEHSEYLLKRITKVSKAAIIEFNELKQRYTDEYDRRRVADAAVIELSAKVDRLMKSTAAMKSHPSLETIQASAQMSNNVPQKLTSTGSFNSLIPREEKLEKELSVVKVHLNDTISEFKKFQELAMNQYLNLEQKFQTELSRKTKSVAVSAKSSHEEPVKHAHDESFNIPRNDFSASVSRKEDTNDVYGKHSGTSLSRTEDKSDGFGKLQELLSSYNKDHHKDDEHVELDNINPEDEETIQKLLDSSSESRSLLTLRSSRVFEAAAKPIALLGSSKSRENLGKFANSSSNTMKSSNESPRPESAVTLYNTDTMKSSSTTRSEGDSQVTNLSTGSQKAMSRESIQDLQSVFDELESKLGVTL